MAINLQYANTLADQTASNVTQSESNWADFLETSSRLYKYPFQDQLMIHAQNPNATACASYNFWDNKMHRYVRRGSKGIALIDNNGGKQRIKYVYDVADTGRNHRRENPRTPELWTMKLEYEAAVTESLAKVYGKHGDNLEYQLVGVAQQLAKESFNDYLRDLRYNSKGSLLDEMDSFELAFNFREALVQSVSYSLMSRCGFDAKGEFINKNFDAVLNFNTSNTLGILGAAVSDLSEQALRQIERTIKTFEREKNLEANRGKSNVIDLFAGRGVSETQHSNAGTGESTDREIRTNENELSEKPQERPVQRSDAELHVEQSLSGNQRNGEQSVGTDDERNVREEPAAGQSNRPNGVGTAHEQLESDSGRNNNERVSVQLSLNDIETEQENQISEIVAEDENSSAFSFAYFVNDTVHLEQDKAFRIENIDTDSNKIILRDLSFVLLSRSMQIDEFEHLLSTNARNSHMITAVESEQKPAPPSVKTSTVIAETQPQGNQLWQDYQFAADKNPDAILLYRVGDFFEVMGDNASIVAEHLDLSIASRDVGLTERVPMVGFPDFKLTEYVKKLVENGLKMAVIEPLSERGLVKLHPELLNEPTPQQLQIEPAATLPQQSTEAPTVPEVAPPVPVYGVGDTVYLENNRRFIIDSIGEREIRLLDPNLAIPIFRALNVGDFERLLEENPKNSHLFEQSAQETEPTAVETSTQPPEIIPQQSTEKPAAVPDVQRIPNFRITDDDLGVGGAKTKYGFNVAAIRTLQAIEAENRLATPEEQEILSRYVGWGGLPQAFDPTNTIWAKEHTELKNLLSEAEFNSAQASTLNAHYTSPTVIKAMYEAVERMGFKSGNILEPSMGTGNFFGLLPENMAQSKLYGVELDGITGRIAKQLYQNADIKVSGFEKTNYPDSFFDLAIGNVPFGSYKLLDKPYDKHNFLIHDYFFAKTLDKVRPGGVVAFVTSKGTLDKENSKVRKYLAQRAELLGAIRLPSNAFLANAGTEVTADIIFLQKRDRLIDIEPEWVFTNKDENGVPMNSYFIDNP